MNYVMILKRVGLMAFCIMGVGFLTKFSVDRYLLTGAVLATLITAVREIGRRYLRITNQAIVRIAIFDLIVDPLFVAIVLPALLYAYFGLMDWFLWGLCGFIFFVTIVWSSVAFQRKVAAVD